MPTQPYRIDGDRVPGVTTVIGASLGWNKGPLMHWAFRQGQEGRDSLYEKRDEAADAGTLAHLMVEHHIKKLGPPEEWDKATPEVRELATQAYESFLAWEEGNRITFTAVEVPLVSETYRFGGTIDAIAELNGKSYLIDFKTSNDVYADHKIQLAAYNQLLYENGFTVHGFHLLRFGKDDAEFAHHYYSDLSREWEAFILLRRLYDLKKEMKA